MDGEEIQQTSGSRRSSDRKQTETEKEVKEMAKPLLHIHCITEKYCDYPVAVKVAMDDGSVQTYVLENSMSPKCQKARCAFEESVEISIGYQYDPHPRRRKNRIHRWHDEHGHRG